MTIEKILQNAIKLIEADLQTIQSTMDSEGALDNKQASKLTDYTKTLIIASKNDREITKLEGLQSISDDELEKLAKEALEELNKGDSDD